MTVNNSKRNRRLRLWKEQEGRCGYCDCDMIYHSAEGTDGNWYDAYSATIDHMHPKRQGGTSAWPRSKPGIPVTGHVDGNSLLVCDTCNGKKGGSTVGQFMDRHGKYLADRRKWMASVRARHGHTLPKAIAHLRFKKEEDPIDEPAPGEPDGVDRPGLDAAP